MSKIKKKRKNAMPSKTVSAGKPRHAFIQTKAYKNKSERLNNISELHVCILILEEVRQKGLPQAYNTESNNNYPEEFFFFFLK